MIRRLAVMLLLMLSFSSEGLSDEVVPAPKDVPPVLGLAVVSEPGSTKNKASEWTIRLSVPRIAWEVVGEVVPKSQWPELKADVQTSALTLRMGGPSALAPSRIVDLEGHELSRDQILKRLARETPVLVSVSGRMPDAYFLQLTKPDTLIVILGPRDGAPSPQLLPEEKGSGATPAQDRQTAGQSASSIEFRWAELSSQPNVTEPNGVDLSCSDQKAYLHTRPILSNQDIADLQLRKSNASSGDRFMIEAYLTADGRKKIAESCQENRDKPLVFLVDGKIVAAMIVKSDLSDFVPIAGNFTEAQAQRIVRGIAGSDK